MTTQEPYNQRTLNIQAAEFYKSIRKEKSKWESIIDLSPMLAEFRHYIASGDYEKAFHVYDEIFGYLANWSENLRLIEMGEKLLEKGFFGKSLPEHMIMRIITYISWGCLFSGQLDKGEKAALEARNIGEKLLGQESSDDYSHKNIYEFLTIAYNLRYGFCVYTGRHEQLRTLLSEADEQSKNVESTRYKARFNMWQAWALQNIGDEKSFEKHLTADLLFDKVEGEEKLDVFFLGEKERCKLGNASELVIKGLTEAGYKAYEESLRIHEEIHSDLFPIIAPHYGGPSLRSSYKLHKSRNIANEGLSIAEKAENPFYIEKNTMYLGNTLRDAGFWHIYMNKSKTDAFSCFQAAIDTYQRSAEMANTMGIAADESMLYGKIGNIYCRLGDGDPGLFVLAEENLKKALDLAQSDRTKYGTCLNLGRLYVYEAGKIYKDSRGRRKEEAVSKVNQANEHFTRVYEDAGKKDDNGSVVKDANGNVVWDKPVYGAKAAYRLGVAAIGTALVNELEGDDKKKKFEEAAEKFHEAADLFKKCAAEVKKNKFLSGREAEHFREKYGEEPIDLRSLAEMKYGRAVALLGVLVFADEYVSEKEVKEHRKREVKQAYEDAFSQVPDSIEFLREAFRELNMLRASLGKEENRVQKAMDDSRKVIICTWLEKNRGIEEKYDETAELNWGFPISQKVIEEFLADNNCDEILGKTG